jgi:transcriptional regulator with XRE-family HTH domain
MAGGFPSRLRCRGCVAANRKYHLRGLHVGWRERLRDAVRESGRKQSIIALDAGIAPESLSRILSGRTSVPGFETIARIAYAAGVPLGWIPEEDGFELSPLQIGEMLEVIAILQNAIDTSETAERLRLRRFLEDGTLSVVHSTLRREVEGEYAWRTMIQRVRQDEYRERVAKLLPLLRVFRQGRLEIGGSGGASGMIFVRTPDKRQFYIGGAHAEIAEAIAEAVNLVLDLTASERRDEHGTRSGTVTGSSSRP